MTEDLENIRKSKSLSSTRVLELSAGINREKYDSYLKDLITDNLDFFPTITSKLLGKDANTYFDLHKKWDQYANTGKVDLSSEEFTHYIELQLKLDKAIIQFIDTQFDTDRSLAAAMKHYQQVTKKLVDDGKILVVSAGNNGEGHIPGSSFNWLGMSPYVIAVGASSSLFREHYHSSVDLFSSWGNSQYHPTVVAPGYDVPVSDDKDKLGLAFGTSFSAPLVADVINLMLEQNPSLKFDSVQKILQTTAVKLPDAPEAAQGAGLLDGAAAILAARASANK